MAKLQGNIHVPDRRECVAGLIWLPLCYLALPALLRRVIPDPHTLNRVFFAVNFAACCTLLRRFLTDSPRLADDRKRCLRAFGSGLLLHYGGTALIFLAMLFAGLQPHSAANDSALALVRESPLLMLPLTVIAVPVAEECLFRGVLFGALCRKYRLAAYALSALAFCAVHLTADAAPDVNTLLSGALYLPAGVALCHAYESSGTIRTSILLHAAINAVSYVLAFLI